MTIRKQGSATGRVLGVENADPELESALGEEPEGKLAGRPILWQDPAADGDDD
jgi:hypothetical protein